MFSHLLIPCQKHVNKKLYLYTEPLIQQYNCHEAKIVQINENPIINIFNGLKNYSSPSHCYIASFYQRYHQI